ncbi:hypothetical protein [Alsobacter sp. R-9]
MPVEDLAEWFVQREDHHAHWRAAALRRALTRMSRTASAGTEEASRFSMALADYLARFHGHALSHKPGVDKSGPTFRYPGTSANKMLGWKFATNQMTFQIMGPVIDVPPVDLSQPLEAQVTTVEAAVDAARRLIELGSETPLLQL